MAIIINDFEIIVEEPPETEEPQRSQEEEIKASPPPNRLRPEDIASVVRFYEERAERLTAD